VYRDCAVFRMTVTSTQDHMVTGHVGQLEVLQSGGRGVDTGVTVIIKAQT